MKIGDWIIWDEYICSIKPEGCKKYRPYKWNLIRYLKKARLCRWDEIPEEFRELQYEIY